MKKDGRYALFVDGTPYLRLGAQVHNSSAWPAMLPKVWPAMEALHVNTVEIPIYWEQFEPRQGQYDHTVIDALLAGARQHTRSGVLFVETFKERARWVPFHRSLCRELDGYLADRRKYAPSGPDARFFVGVNQRFLLVETAGDTLRRLFTRAGLKPEKGRVGPRPYDLRHAFAVHRLSR